MGTRSHTNARARGRRSCSCTAAPRTVACGGRNSPSWPTSSRSSPGTSCTVALELYRHHPELVATLILVDTYAGWKGSLPKEEVRARVAGVLHALEAPPGENADPLPGWFAGDPPAEFVPLLDEMATDVRRESVRTAMLAMAEADQRDVLPTIAVPTLLLWGELDVRSPLPAPVTVRLHAAPRVHRALPPQAGVMPSTVSRSTAVSAYTRPRVSLPSRNS
jgi:pimeloyl-ACP methyl ester carboxylesterase